MSPFTRSATLPDDELEARIRATLRRHADEIEPTQPPWSELVAQAGAVVLPLHGTELPAAHLRHRRGPHFSGPWLRPTMAAAVALLIAMSAAIVVQGRDGGGAPADGGEGGTISDAAIDGPLLAPPGGFDFDRLTATALSVPRELEEVGNVTLDPKLLADAFLFDAGLADNGARFLSDEPAFEPLASDNGQVMTATVWWSVRDDDNLPIADGPVFLRESAPGGPWEVIGAYTRTLVVGLTRVQRGNDSVAFTVNDYLDDPAVRVLLNGVEIDRAAFGADGTKRYVEPDPAPDQVATIQVQHMIGDVPASITAMALPPTAEVARFEPTAPETRQTVSVPVSR